MSKVVLTKEQAEAIESLKELWKEKTAEARNNILIKEKVNGGYDSNGFYKSLNVLSVSNFAESLFGYEIEQPGYEVGDWVIWETKFEKVVVQIKKKFTDSYGGFRINEEEYHSDYIVRHATPEEIHADKERIFWAELGREVGEFRSEDVVQTKGMIKPYKLQSKQDLLDAKNDYFSVGLLGFYPAESFKPFPTGNNP